ncbi:DEAD/DEAH box helicase [Peribacillus simplex]|uniref:DEAD/DEAH box helicase n=2 Tax=Peribacillus simplex TaxID=1478 RepID=A0A9X8R3Z4_9BACI|nr:DEAD/DEAH box helicase [Peribacillus simplex]
MKNEELNYQQIIELIEQGNLSIERCFSIFMWVNRVTQNKAKEGDGRDVILRMMDKIDKLPKEIEPILNDYVGKLGYFPYLDVNKEFMSARDLLRYEFYRSENIPNIVMHQKQAEVYDVISNHQSVILSAPTSFGKSLLIEEIVASKEYYNIVIILPTLALIDETRMKLVKYSDVYKLIFSSKQSFGKRNIFILTPERLLEIEGMPVADFFIIDEFYKLDSSRSEDERLNVLNHAFYRLIKSTDKFYLLGPNIAAIPKGFEVDYACKFIPSDFTTVACDEIFIKREKKRELEQLVELLKNLYEPTMVYCKAPGSAERNVKEFLEKANSYLTKNKHHNDAINWIKKNIHPDWLLISALSHGVAFHHGAMPRHLGRYIVEEFNKGTIKYLFCTSTLIEGINTTAKNVVVFEDKKGIEPITFFDYRNIRGRAGRMKKHFLGRVYSFYNPPKDIDVNVDIPWYTQDKASDEILIQVEEGDLKPASIEKLKPYKEQKVLEIEVIKKNNNIPVKGQVELAELIQGDLDYYQNQLTWTSYPTYNQLETCCTLIFNYLRFKHTKDEVYSGKQLAFYVRNYVRVQSNMAKYIHFFLTNDIKIKTADQAVQKATKISRSWFEFRFPKLLLGLQQIQEAVFKQNGLPFGDYKFYASQIEFAFCSPTLSSLQEFGLPISLLRQLEPYMDMKELENNDDLDKVITQIKKMDVSSIHLDPFETKLLKDFVKG